MAHKQACHALAGTVFNTVAGIDYQLALILILLEHTDGGGGATHIQDYGFAHNPFAELLFTVDVHHIATAAQLLGSRVEDIGVVAYMVRRIRAFTHHAGYLDF